MPGRQALRGDRGRRGPGRPLSEAADRARTRWSVAPATRPTRRWSDRVGAPRRLRGPRDPGRALVRGAGRTPWPAACGGSTCSAAGCTPTRRPPPREFDRGRRHVPVAEVISGVVDPPGPDEVRAWSTRCSAASWSATSPTPCSVRRRSPGSPPRAGCRPSARRRRVVVRLGRVGLAADHPGRPAPARRAAGADGAAGR